MVDPSKNTERMKHSSPVILTETHTSTIGNKYIKTELHTYGHLNFSKQHYESEGEFGLLTKSLSCAETTSHPYTSKYIN